MTSSRAQVSTSINDMGQAGQSNLLALMGTKPTEIHGVQFGATSFHGGSPPSMVVDHAVHIGVPFLAIVLRRKLETDKLRESRLTFVLQFL